VALVLEYAGIVMRQKNQEGITLMEMMLAVAILGILLIISMLSFIDQLGKGRDGRRKEDIHLLKTAVEQYYDDHGCYPPAEMVVCESTSLDPYIEIVPCDPINHGDYVYDYLVDGCDGYVIYTSLEHRSDPVVVSLGCSSGCGIEGNYNYYVASAGQNAIDPTPPITPTPTVPPLCDGSCLPNQCMTCCPGAGYRCTGSGDGCFVDETCTN